MKKSSFLKTSFCLLLTVSMFMLTACGGGGHSSSGSASTKASVKVTVPGALLSPSLRSNQTAALRADVDITKLILQTKAYLNGNLVSGVSIDNLQATLSGSNYVFEVKDLLNTYEYRFSALYNNKVILQNQISQNQVTEGNEIPVDVTTSYKVLAYDAWVAENPTSKTLDAFAAAAATAGVTDFSTLSAVSSEDYQNTVKQIINGEEVSVPTKDDVKPEEIKKIPTNVVPTPTPDVQMTAAQHASVFKASIYYIFAMVDPCMEALEHNSSNSNVIANMPSDLKAFAKGSVMNQSIPDTFELFQADTGISGDKEIGSIGRENDDFGVFGRGVYGTLVSKNALVALGELDKNITGATKFTGKLIFKDKYIIGLGYFTVNGQDYTLSVVIQSSYREGAHHPNDYHIGYGKIWKGTRTDVDFDTNEGYVGKIEKNLNAVQDFDATKLVYTSNNGDAYTHWYSFEEGQEGGDGDRLTPVH